MEDFIQQANYCWTLQQSTKDDYKFEFNPV